MSRNSVIKIVAGTDTLEFDTANRALCEALKMHVGQIKTYKGGDAVAFLNGNIEWHNNVTDHYRKIVMMLTDFHRMHYSDSLLAILSNQDDRPMTEKFAEVEANCMLEITIHYQD